MTPPTLGDMIGPTTKTTLAVAGVVAAAAVSCVLWVGSLQEDARKSNEAALEAQRKQFAERVEKLEEKSLSKENANLQFAQIRESITEMKGSIERLRAEVAELRRGPK